VVSQWKHLLIDSTSTPLWRQVAWKQLCANPTYREIVKAEQSPGSFQSGVFAFVRGAWHYKIIKTPLIYSVSRFHLGGLELCLGGLSPPKSSRGDRTEAELSQVTPRKLAANLEFFIVKISIFIFLFSHIKKNIYLNVTWHYFQKYEFFIKPFCLRVLKNVCLFWPCISVRVKWLFHFLKI